MDNCKLAEDIKNKNNNSIKNNFETEIHELEKKTTQ